MHISTLTKEYLDTMTTEEVYGVWNLALSNELMLSMVHGAKVIEATIEVLAKEYRARLC